MSNENDVVFRDDCGRQWVDAATGGLFLSASMRGPRADNSWFIKPDPWRIINSNFNGTLEAGPFDTKEAAMAAWVVMVSGERT